MKMNDDWRNKNDFPKGVGLFAGGFSILFVAILTMAVGTLGVFIWAIITLVNHFTS
jgi:hypothetical protein